MGNLNSFTCGILHVVILLFFLCSQAGAKIVLTPESSTVAGISAHHDEIDGYPGVSMMQNPRGMCSFGDPTKGDVLVVATANRFRVLNRTNYLRKWFGKDPKPDCGKNTDGNISDVYLMQPQGCARFVHPISPEKSTIYYVNNDNFVRWVDNDKVTSKAISDSYSLSGIAVYNNYLFAIESYKSSMIRCTISSENVVPMGCNKIDLDKLTQKQQSRDIVATNDGIFVSFGEGLNWYNSKGVLLSSISDIPICSVAHDPASNTLWVATSSAVYNISVDQKNRQIHFDLFAGTESANCSVCDNKDGINPTFHGIQRLYVKSLNEMYLSFPSLSVMRVVVVPAKVVEILLDTKPFPINMTGAEADLNKLYDLMDSSVNGKLKTNGTLVNRTGGSVLSNWTTKLSLIVQGREFDNETTESEIHKMTFPEMLGVLEAYYANTNQVVYSDATLLPVYNTSIMNTLEHAIADRAREVLNYSLIYTDPYQTVPLDATRNMTLVKLLLPASFENQTTRDLLSQADFPNLLLDALRTIYPPDHQYTVKLPMRDYPFDKLSPSLEQTARLRVLSQLEVQLQLCASQTTGLNRNAESVTAPPQPAEGGARIGITNRTLVAAIDHPSGVNEFESFIPVTYPYTFSISKCLDETSWDDLKHWIGNTTVIVHHSTCETGCIVGIAVAAAVLVAILIILVVVLVSKRRRLATVLVPKVYGDLNEKMHSEELR